MTNLLISLTRVTLLLVQVQEVVPSLTMTGAATGVMTSVQERVQETR